MDPNSNRAMHRQLEARARVRVGQARECPRCGEQYRPQHRGAFLCSPCFELLVADGVRYDERLRYLAP